MANKRLNLVRIVKEYYMMKSVLENEEVQKLLKGEIEATGTSPARDMDVLRVMNDYINELGQMKIAKKGIDKKYITFDEYLNKLQEQYINIDEAKVSGKADYSLNPFDDRFVVLVSGMLSLENADEKIRQALDFNVEVNDKIAELPILLGGKKQSSYVQLLTQYSEIFGEISDLQNQIAELQASGKGKDAEIARLQKELDDQIKRAEEFKGLAERSLTGTTRDDADRNLEALLAQSLDNLTKVITGELEVQGRTTRRHVTAEADRIINTSEENLYKFNRIENQIRANFKMYPYSIKILTNTGYVQEKNMQDVCLEVQRAAETIGLNKEEDVVSAFYNSLNRQNDSQKTNNKGRVTISVISGLLAAGIGMGAGIMIGQQMSNTHNQAHIEIDNYYEYEIAQRDTFEDQLNQALENGTFYDMNNNELPNFEDVSIDGVDVHNASTVKDYKYFAALIAEYSKNDEKEDHQGYSSTQEMETLYKNAKLTVLTEYYETNYANLLSLVSSLNSQIESLTAELEQANADKAALQSQIDALQARIDELQGFLDAAEQRNSELQNLVDELQGKLDAATDRIEQLEEENENLREENATLREQVNSLTNEISDLLEEIQQLKYDKSVLLNDVADLNAQIYRNEKLIAQLQQQLESAQSGDYTELLEQIATLQAELEESKQEIADLVATNESLRAELVSLQQQLSESVNSYNELLNRYNELLNSGDGASSEELAALRAELAAAYSTIANYESKIVAIWNGFSGQSTTNEDAMQDLENLLTLFGIDYNDKGASSYSSSDEYEP